MIDFVEFEKNYFKRDMFKNIPQIQNVWRNYHKKLAKTYALNPDLKEWFKKRLIIIYPENNISTGPLNTIKLGIEEMFNQNNINLNVKINKTQSSKNNIDYLIKHSIKNYLLDISKLEKQIIRNKINEDEELGKIIITKSKFLHDKTHKSKTNFLTGTSIISIGDNYKNLNNKLKRISMHTAGHFLGKEIHHDENNLILNYKNTHNCIMSKKPWIHEYDKICNHCKLEIKYFLEEFGKLNKFKFFK